MIVHCSGIERNIQAHDRAFLVVRPSISKMVASLTSPRQLPYH